MSEIRETTTVREVSVPEPEPVVSFADILVGVGSLTRTASMVERGKASRSKAPEKVQMATPSSLVRIGEVIRDSASAKEAIQILADNADLNISSSDGDRWKRLLRRVVETNDKPLLARAVAEISGNQQKRIQKSIVAITKRVLARRGFSTQGGCRREGLIVAKRPGTTQMMSIDISRSKDGTVQIHFDLDGFYGGACVDELNGVQEDLAREGVRTATNVRRRKESRPVYDGHLVATEIRQLG